MFRTVKSVSGDRKMFTKSRAAQEVEERLKAFAQYLRENPELYVTTLQDECVAQKRRVVYTANLEGAFHRAIDFIEKEGAEKIPDTLWSPAHEEIKSTLVQRFKVQKVRELTDREIPKFIEALGGEVFYGE